MPPSTQDIDWRSLGEAHLVLKSAPEYLRARAVPHRLASGVVLHRVGDRVRNVYAVLSGEVRLRRLSRDGRETVLQRARSGFVAEASLGHRAYHCDLVSGPASALLALPVRQFRDALDRDAGFRDAWMAHLSRELRLQRLRNERLSLPTAAERIFHCIETEGVGGVLTLAQSRKSWSAELGITHEALYRALARLKATDRIEVEGLRIAALRADGE